MVKTGVGSDPLLLVQDKKLTEVALLMKTQSLIFSTLSHSAENVR